jgi:hypothetical protein
MLETYFVVSAIALARQIGPYPVPCYFDFRGEAQSGPYPQPCDFDFRQEAEANANDLLASGKPEMGVATCEDLSGTA